MDWSIQDIALLAGTTSRTLRHYDHIGLLVPSRVGANGYRYYNDAALMRLQRILLLRELGLGLAAIADLLAGNTDDAVALRTHLEWLRAEQQRLGRQITSVTATITAMEGGEQIMAEDMLDGFDHTTYKDEVEQKWGTAAYATSDAWWRSKSAAEKADWKQRQEQLAADWIAAAERGIDPTGDEAQALAKRHVDWLTAIPGTPGRVKEYVTGLGEMYVADERFAANYGGLDGATFVRDALAEYASRSM
jgi:MerR family transcriptional regulator, thiopeptide resistance regulator